MSDTEKCNCTKLALAVVCIGLAYLGFEYNSGWAFFGSVIAYLSV